MKLRKIAIFALLFFVLLGIGNTTEKVQAATKTSASTKAAISATTKQKKTTKLKKAKKAKKASKASYTKKQLRLMATIINCEAGNQCFQGKLAVGIVVMNRVRSGQFPNTIRGVIYQSGQFSPVTNGSLRLHLSQYDAGKTSSYQWKECIRAAKKVLKGQTYITINGKKKNFKSYHFFSVVLSGARFRLQGHMFK